MQIRHNQRSKDQRPIAASRDSAGFLGARIAARWLPTLLLVTLVLSAALVLSGQASATKRIPVGERSQPIRISKDGNSVEIGCTSVAWEFTGFTPTETHVITERVSTFRRKESHSPVETKIILETKLTFTGSSGSNVTPIDAPPGVYTIDTEAEWFKPYEGVGKIKNHFDLHEKVECHPRTGLKLEKLQRIEGSGAGYASTAIPGEVGQTVEYEILATNTGNVALEVGSLTDPRCDEGTFTGGPTGGILEPEATATYDCTHKLDANDLTVHHENPFEDTGNYENTAELAAATTSKETLEPTASNTVITEVKPEGFKKHEEEVKKQEVKKQEEEAKKKQEEESNAKTTTTAAVTPPDVGKTGVLGFSATSVPALKGPQGCVRSRYVASIKSAGVAKVVFYLDGHKLKTLSSRNARKGLLSITIDTSKLKTGAHHLTAKITMAPTASDPKTSQGTRTLTVLRCRSNVVTPKFTG